MPQPEGAKGAGVYSWSWRNREKWQQKGDLAGCFRELAVQNGDTVESQIRFGNR